MEEVIIRGKSYKPYRQGLYLEKLNIESIQEIKNLKWLIVLDISNYNFNKIPDVIYDMELSFLDVSGNSITKLPKKIGALKHHGKGVYGI